MKCDIGLGRPVRLFQVEEHARASRLAARAGLAVYTWKTTGRSNWLERRLSNVDALGLVLLPRGFGERLDLADDAE